MKNVGIQWYKHYIISLINFGNYRGETYSYIAQFFYSYFLLLIPTYKNIGYKIIFFFIRIQEKKIHIFNFYFSNQYINKDNDTQQILTPPVDNSVYNKIKIKK